MCQLQNIESLLKANKPGEALVLLDEYLGSHPDDARAFFLRGKACWRLGDRPGALSAYSAAAQLDPESPAVYALEQARDVEAFFNPDLLNP